MTATTSPRLTSTAGPIPSKGTLPMPANTLLLKGTIVQVDSDGRAVANKDDANQHAAGKCSMNYDNRTGSIAGGADDDLNCEVEYGVFGWKGEDGHLPKVGDVAYVVDNQTVSNYAGATSKRGYAGYCVEVRDGLYWIWMGPHVVAQITLATGVAAGLASAVGDITDLQGEVDDLQTDAARGFLPIPLSAFVLAANGAPTVVYADGTDGTAYTEGLHYRFNDGTTAAIGTTVPLPQDLDATEDVEIHFLASRVGSENVDTVLTVSAFFQTVGAAYNADAECGGNTEALAADTTVVQELSVAIDAANVPAAPCALSFSVVPDAELANDDLLIHACWLEYTKALTTT